MNAYRLSGTQLFDLLSKKVNKYTMKWNISRYAHHQMQNVLFSSFLTEVKRSMQFECIIISSHVLNACKNLSLFCIKVCLPLLSNKKNHQMWPKIISQDVSQHIENLQSKVTVVRGQYNGKTVLPIPAIREWIDQCQEATFMLYEYF